MQTTRPKIGKQAPNFSGTAYHNGEFKQVQLSDFKDKYIVLFFYPLDFTFVCPTEILSFSQAKPEFDKLNTVLLGCSVDSHYVHMKWCKTKKKQGGIGEIDFPLISDLSKDIAKAYDCLIEDGPDKGVALRATFIIDGKGILRQMSVNDLDVGRNIDEILRLVKAFQFVEENGEVCPAKWKKKGDATMKTDHKEETTKKYFEQVHGE